MTGFPSKALHLSAIATVAVQPPLLSVCSEWYTVLQVVGTHPHRIPPVMPDLVAAIVVAPVCPASECYTLLRGDIRSLL